MQDYSRVLSINFNQLKEIDSKLVSLRVDVFVCAFAIVREREEKEEGGKRKEDLTIWG